MKSLTGSYEDRYGLGYRNLIEFLNKNSIFINNYPKSQNVEMLYHHDSSTVLINRWRGGQSFEVTIFSDKENKSKTILNKLDKIILSEK